MSKLTAKKVESLAKGAPGHYADGNNLWLVVPKSGLAYWVFKYTLHKNRRQMTLDKINVMSLAEARKSSAAIKADLTKGFDPLAQRKREQSTNIKTVNQLFDDWHETLVKRLKHPNIPKRVYINDIAQLIGELAAKQVNPRDIRAILQKITTSNRPTIANDALMYFKQLFNHGIKLDIVQGNPASAFNCSDAGGIEKSRSRTLELKELKHAFKVFREYARCLLHSRINQIAL